MELQTEFPAAAKTLASAGAVWLQKKKKKLQIVFYQNYFETKYTRLNCSNDYIILGNIVSAVIIDYYQSQLQYNMKPPLSTSSTVTKPPFNGQAYVCRIVCNCSRSKIQ